MAQTTWTYGPKISIAITNAFCFIKSNLNGNVIDIKGASAQAGALLDAYPQKTTGTDNQLWEFVSDPARSGYSFIKSKLDGNVIDIQGASTKAAAPLDAYPQKTTGTDNQLWDFVVDPAGSGCCFINSKLMNGDVIDILGASTSSGAGLDAYPLKATGYDNQLWTAVGGAFPSVIQTVPPPPGTGLISNYNYFLGGGGKPLLGVSVALNISVDLLSSSNGWSIQLNGYSTEGPGITTEWQQFVIYLLPNSTQLWARIDTWSGTAISDELVRADVALANLPSQTVKAGYQLKFILTYNGNVVTGATYTVTDETGKSLGQTTIGIVGQILRTTGKQAAAANLAPIAAFQLNIGGDWGGNSAMFTSGAGAIIYAASNPLMAASTEPSYTDFDDGTGESGNVIFGAMPAVANQLSAQSFLVSTAAAPAITRIVPPGQPAPRTRALPPRQT